MAQTANKASLANQKMCGDAAKAYSREHYGTGIEADIISTYTAHYNSRLNRCFIQTDITITKTHARDVAVIDVFEEKSYGNLLKGPGGSLCQVYNAGLNDTVSCDNDETKFLDLAKALMSD